MNHEPTTCAEQTAAISNLIAEELTAQETQKLRQHLAVCPRCREHVQQLSALGTRLSLAKPLHDDFDLAGIVARAMAQVANERQQPASSSEAFSARVTNHLLGIATVLMKNSASRRARQRIAVVLTVSSLLLGLVIYSQCSPSLREKSMVEAKPPATQSLLAGSVTAETVPTLLELRRAAAVSDEAFESLLAQGNSTLAVEPPTFQSLWQESSE